MRDWGDWIIVGLLLLALAMGWLSEVLRVVVDMAAFILAVLFYAGITALFIIGPIVGGSDWRVPKNTEGFVYGEYLNIESLGRELEYHLRKACNDPDPMDIKLTNLPSGLGFTLIVEWRHGESSSREELMIRRSGEQCRFAQPYQAMQLVRRFKAMGGEE